MSEPSDPRRFSGTSPAEQASAWVVRFDIGLADAAEFERWRAADPRHAVAFAKAAAVWSELGRAPRPLASRTSPRGDRRMLLRGAAAAGALGLGGALAAQAFARARLQTRVGERRSMRLPDGAELTLNTESLAYWRAGDGGLTVWLERGECGLETARSCRLRAGAHEAELAAGGRYNARLRGPVLDIRVLSGRAVAAGSRAGSPAQAAQSLLLSPAGPVSRPSTPFERESADAWRRGEIVLWDEPLSAAVEEYNRYLTRKLVIADPEVARIRVGGRFTSTDPTDFLKALSASLNVRAVVEPQGVILTAAK